MRLVSIIAISLLAVACKKETEQEPSPYNRIANFTLEAGGATVSAAMSGDSILVYWPSHLPQPGTIQPQIEVSEGAAISPASGTAVVFKTGTAYIVKAQNGREKKFYLKVVISQPPIQIHEGASYTAALGGEAIIDNGAAMRYFDRDPAVTKFYLVDTSGNTTEMNIEFFTQHDGTLSMRVKVPATGVKIGGYRVRISSGMLTHTTENYVFGVLYPSSEKPVPASLDAPVKVKRGETITFAGQKYFDLKDAIAYTYDENYNEKEIMPLPLVSFTTTSATYRIPANFPAGTYQFGDWGPNAIGIRMRITNFIGWWNWETAPKNFVEIPGYVAFTVAP